MEAGGHLGGQRKPTHTVLAFTLTLALFTFVTCLVLSPSISRRLHRRLIRPCYALLGRIPTPSAFATPSDLAIAVRSFSGYAHSQQSSLDRKWLAFERMPKRHRALGNKIEWKETLRNTEDAVHEVNAVVTDQLAALGREQARREGVPLGFRSSLVKETGRVIEVRLAFSFPSETRLI
jgi:hypothetical protein